MYPLSSLCRVCLIKGEKLISIFGSSDSISLYRKLMVCINTEVSESDELPTVICEKCLVELDISYKFITKCRESEVVLKEYFKSPENFVILDVLKIKEENDLENFDTTDNNDGVEWDEEVKIELGDDIVNFLNHKQPVNIKNLKARAKQKNARKARKLKNHRKHCKLKCSICGLVAVSRSALIIHYRKHTGEKPYSCSHCDRYFSQKGTMKNHIIRRHLKRRLNLEMSGYTCEVCGKCFIRRRDVKIHLRLHTGERPYVCTICQMSFTQIGPLIRHKRIHTGERPFTCEKCGKRFADKSMVKMHQNVHSDVRNFSCDICGKAVKSKNTLIKHLTYHSNSKPNICHECGAAFSTKGNLKAHMSNLHSEKSGICSVCQKFFSDLASHTRKHTGETLFECDICHRRFMQKSSYTVHMNKHKNLDKYKCGIDDCKLGFPLKCMLDFHILKYHKNITPFVCSDCDRGFYRSGDLTKHIKTHHLNKN